MSDWQDRIVGARMQVDNEFEDRVQQSSFSRQQWGLVMTAVEFEIEHPADPERARLVADTSNLTHVLDELENVDAQMSAMGGTAMDSSSGGLLDSVKDALGLGGGDGSENTAELEAEAAELTQSYADALQAKLEEQGRWEDVREAAA